MNHSLYSILLLLAVQVHSEEILELVPAPSPGAKSGTLELTSSDASALLSNAIYIVPMVAFIILLDFAIFGAYASRSDELNPISDFFYHVRRGFNIVTQRTGATRHHNLIYQKYHKTNRYQR